MDIGTGLHARKKCATHDIDPEDASPTSPAEKSRRRRISLPASLRSELGCAIEIVVLFLIGGVCLGYFFMHHQHKNIAYHIMRDPVGHGAFEGRSGFRHHFYTGNPHSVTIVLPSVVRPEKRKRRLDSIFETWGPSARAIYVVHNVSEFPQADPHAKLSENSMPVDPYSYPQILLVPPNIGFGDGLPRLNYVIRAVYEKINPDFAFFVNDHTFVIPEHLCNYLEDKKSTDQIYHGHALKEGKEDAFNSGAAGYILSRASMKAMVQKWDEGDPTCSLKDGSKWLQGNPGLVTARCLKQVLGVEEVDTRERAMYHRFHAFPLTRMVAGALDGWYRKKHDGMGTIIKTDKSYETLLSGADCCAHTTISFHYVEHLESRALFAVREALLKNPHMSDLELKSFMVKEWPHDAKEIGYYSRALPEDTDQKQWKAMLDVMRKISERQAQREC